MNLYAEFLNCLEHARSIDARVISAELRGCALPFAARRWIVPDGYQTSILAPVLNCEEEVVVVVDQERGTFRYNRDESSRDRWTRSPSMPSMSMLGWTRLLTHLNSRTRIAPGGASSSTVICGTSEIFESAVHTISLRYMWRAASRNAQTIGESG